MIEHTAPEPIAGYVIGIQVMDPQGVSVFYLCLFAMNLNHAARMLARFSLAEGYTIRDAFIAPSPTRIMAPLKQRGLRGRL